MLTSLTSGPDHKISEMCLVDPQHMDSVAAANGSVKDFRDLHQFLSLDEPLPGGMCLSVWVVSGSDLRNRAEDYWKWIREHPEFDIKMIVLSDEQVARIDFEPIPEEYIQLVVPGGLSKGTLGDIIHNAFYSLRLRNEKLQLQSRLALSSQELHRLTRVGQSLSTERDFEVLINQILGHARELVAADGGSIYVIERTRAGQPPTHLRFKKSALNLQANEFLLPIDKNSIAGYVALIGRPLMIDDVYSLSGDEEYRFNYEFDRSHNYYTKSMMVVPMKNHKGNVIGVLQLINKKRQYSRKLTLEQLKGPDVLAFNEKDLDLVQALAGQAAVAIENNQLIQDIENLFEGFVTASVTAIEQRDPTTSGHSFRVAEYCVELAKAVDNLRDGPFAAAQFSHEQIREIRYASLLHDFGKVGVREQVLVKAKKLYPHESELIDWRFRYMSQLIEKHYTEKKLRFLKNNDRELFDDYEKLVDEECRERLREVEEMLAVIRLSNEPTVMESGNFEKLEQIARKRMRTPHGETIPFLTNNELLSLSIRRGNLNQQERLEIESHVSHTYRFLIQIPWTGDLAHVPDIAHGHHEKLDGTGYPLGLEANEISLQTRMMTISDIYDALTAPDRPYKKSMPAERALDILKLESKEGRIDGDLLDLFVKADIFRVTENVWDS